MQERSLYLAAALAAVPGLAWGMPQAPAGRGPARVLICHVPPENPGQALTLELPQPAVKAHLRHGDRLGACDGSPIPVNAPRDREHEAPEIENDEAEADVEEAGAARREAVKARKAGGLASQPGQVSGAKPPKAGGLASQPGQVGGAEDEAEDDEKGRKKEQEIEDPD